MLRALLAIGVTSCSAAAPIHARNDPHDAKLFSCTRSEPHPEYDVCFTAAPACSAELDRLKTVGVFSSPCYEQLAAWCYFATFDDGPAFECTPERDTCLARQHLNRAPDTGECVFRHL